VANAANENAKIVEKEKDVIIQSLKDEIERAKQANLSGSSQLSEVEERWKKVLEEETNKLRKEYKKALNKVIEENKVLTAQVERGQEQNVALNKQKDILEEKLGKVKRVHEGELVDWRRRVEELETTLSSREEEWGVARGERTKRWGLRMLRSSSQANERAKRERIINVALLGAERPFLITP